ncbi:MAG: hypothetical protein J6A59_09855 [Lachnospiraceae bacterium]|nr:hypothetical protein [Lachnospiraceae bacterium]
MVESLTVEQKFARIMLCLRDILPYYSTFYEALPKEEDKRIDTVGVTVNKMIYNNEFIGGRPVDELIFIMLHEMTHIGLMHPARLEGRDPELWNIACDLYVNKLVSEELGGINPGMSKIIKGISITLPKDAWFSKGIDLEKESADSIYNKLYEQSKENGYNSRNKDSIQWDGQINKNFVFNINGTNINVGLNTERDLVSIGNTPLEMQEARKFLEIIQTNYELSGKLAGNEIGMLQVKVGDILKSDIDWRKLLSKYCRELRNSILSFNRPDKRMYYQSAIYPGKQEEISKYINGVKICIDSSGSISDDDIKYFLGQVEDLLKEFKIDAELIWWDTKIQSQGKISSFKDAIRMDAYGRGGTNPKCLFEYFDSKDCKDKPYVILIFTDMYFGSSKMDNVKWKRKYKNTIWVGTRDKNKMFKIPFGKEASIKKFYE